MSHAILLGLHITAVVNWPSPLARVLPSAIGTPLIIRAVKRATHRSTPPSRSVRSGMPA